MSPLSNERQDGGQVAGPQDRDEPRQPVGGLLLAGDQRRGEPGVQLDRLQQLVGQLVQRGDHLGRVGHDRQAGGADRLLHGLVDGPGGHGRPARPGLRVVQPGPRGLAGGCPRRGRVGEALQQ